MTPKFENVKRVYSGRPGCMCGCRGTYSDAERSKKIIFNKIMKGDYKVEGDYVYLDTPTRSLVAFFGE